MPTTPEQRAKKAAYRRKIYADTWESAFGRGGGDLESMMWNRHTPGDTHITDLNLSTKREDVLSFFRFRSLRF